VFIRQINEAPQRQSGQSASALRGFEVFNFGNYGTFGNHGNSAIGLVKEPSRLFPDFDFCFNLLTLDWYIEGARTFGSLKLR
jgi:hypothetical protein